MTVKLVISGAFLALTLAAVGCRSDAPQAAQASAAAPPPTFEFRGLHIGDSIPFPSDAWLCQPVEKKTNSRYCEHSGTTIGDVVLDISYMLVDGKLCSVNWHFAELQFLAMKNAFIEKWGPPTRTDTIPVQNAMGAQFSNVRLTWQLTPAELRLSRYADKIDFGEARISGGSCVATWSKRNQTSAKKDM